MKKILFIVACFFLLATPVLAAEVSFAWQHSDPASVDGFRLFQRSGAEYDEMIWEGRDLTCTIEIDPNIEYAYVVRAFKVMPLSGEVVESPNSNEVFYTPAVEPAQNLILQAIDKIISGLNTIRQVISEQ